MASARDHPYLPLLPILTGIGLDPCQSTEIPLGRWKALHIRFDLGNLLVKEFGFREGTSSKTGKEAGRGILRDIHVLHSLRIVSQAADARLIGNATDLAWFVKRFLH